MLTRMIALCVALAAAPAYAGGRYFPPSESPWFDGWQRQISELVHRNKSEGLAPSYAPAPLMSGSELRLADAAKHDLAADEVCIVGWRAKDPASLHAYVYWPGGDQLITWIPSKGDPESLLHETHKLVLSRDVRDTDAEIDGSNYLETKSWVRHIADQCRRHGVTVNVPTRRG